MAKYTTQRQRDALNSIGIEHVKCRTFEEGNALINDAIKKGLLADNVMTKPTEYQKNELEKMGMFDDTITTEEARTILYETLPATEKQIEYLKILGVKIPGKITKLKAGILIDKHLENSLISEPQADFIEELGGYVAQDMTRKNAEMFIDMLLCYKRTCNSCGYDNNSRSDKNCVNCGKFLSAIKIIYPPKIYLPPTIFDTVGNMILGVFKLIYNKTKKRQGQRP